MRNNKEKKLIAWVPKTELKTKETEKENKPEKEEEEKHGSLMEEPQHHQQEKMKKIHSSLPSNYVTLAQLQERWLQQQQNKINQQQQEKIEDDQRQQERCVAVVVPKNVITVSRSNHRREIEVVSEERRESENGDGIGDGNIDLDGKMDESKTEKKKKKNNNNYRKKWKGKGKPKVDEREGSVAKGNEIAEKTTMKIELKNANSKTVDEVEEKIRVLSVNSGNEKQNWKFKKTNYGFRQSQRSNGHRHGHGHGDLKGKMIWVRKDSNVGEMDT